jgi:hypothetical protein
MDENNGGQSMRVQAAHHRWKKQVGAQRRSGTSQVSSNL